MFEKMKSFTHKTGLMFCLMIGSAVSRPGYNYQPPSGVGLQNNLGALTLSHLGSSHNQGLVHNTKGHTGPLQIVPSQPLSQTYLPPSLGHTTFNDVSQLPLQGQSSFNAVPGFSGQSHNSFQAGPLINGLSYSQGSHSNHINHQVSVPQQRTIVTKEVYVHTAPPEADEEIDFKRQLESIPIRKNYRILFIKAPSQNIRIAAEALKQAQAVNEERTVIYVLSKKADVADLQRQVTQVQGPQTVSRKPEVYFIKYKTNEEAQRAQQEIQAQYDALGGTSHISDEGFAPLTSVVGALGRDNLSALGAGQSGSDIAPSNNYLPPAKV